MSDANDGGMFSSLRQRRQPEREEGLDSLYGGKASGEPRSTSSRRRVGRPKGKRSNPDYTQITCFVRKQNLLRTKGILNEVEADTGRKQNVSDVMDRLLAFYIEHGDPWDFVEE